MLRSNVSYSTRYICLVAEVCNNHTIRYLIDWILTSVYNYKVCRLIVLYLSKRIVDLLGYVRII